MQFLESQIIDQAVILAIFVKILAFLFLGACLTGFVATILWVTSGGSEGRNDTAMNMFRSAFGLAFVVFVCYLAIVFYAKFMGISLV